MVDSDDLKRWDKIHQRTSQEEGKYSVYAEEKEKLFPRNSVVCDLGGGTGDDAIYFLRKGHRVILFDISEFALKAVQKKAKEAKITSGLIVKQVDFGLHKLPLKDYSIDVAYSRISLHYFPKDETIGIFRAIYTALKDGGSAYLTFKSPEDREEMEYFQNNAVLYEPEVYIESGQLRSRFAIDSLKEMLALAGIVDYQVHLYKESLGMSKTGERQVLLLLNEVIFTKT